MQRHVSPWLPRALATAALLLAASLAAWTQSNSLEGQPVVAVRVVDEAGKVLEENPRELVLKVGEPYSIDAERESLRRLYRSGHYDDLRAEVTRVEGGLRLDFVVQQSYFIDVVRVEGLHEPPSEAKALAALRLGLGEPFRESDLAKALDRLHQMLEEEGFYQAQLARELKPNPSTRQMDIVVQATPGPRARLGAITVVNQTRFSSAELLRHAKLKPGTPVRVIRLERATERVRKFLVKKDHLGARVVARRGNYDARSNRLPLELEVTAGPRVRVEVEGAHISQGTLHNLLPVYQEGSVDEDLLQEGRRAIRDYLQRQGYFEAQVSFDIRDDAKTGGQLILYSVERGSRRRLVRVSFDGNKYFGSDLLSSRLSIQPAGFLGRGRYSQQLLQQDEQSIVQVYQASGFSQAAVRSEVVEKKRDLYVRFHISEGPQQRVAALELEGNHALSNEELLSVVGSTPGQPFSEPNVASDRDNILALYYNEGFPQANFQYLAAPADDADRVRLTYRITEGPQIRVKQVLLAGYEHTRPGVIRREVRLQPGGPLREGEVVETQRRLYNLGIFSRVQVAPQNPAGSNPEKTVVVAVEESKRYTLAYGGGIEVQRLGGSSTNPAGSTLSASPRGILELSRSNFAGRAQTLAFKLRASTLQYRGLVSFTAPSFLTNPKFTLLLTGFADKTRDVRTFTSSRYEGSFEVVQRYSATTSFLYRYSFRHVLVNASSLRVSPNQIPLFSQPTRISSFGVSWIRDRRDNPADATRGSFTTTDLSLAATPIGASASFARVFAQNSTFHPLGRRLTFARSARFAVEEPFSDTTGIEIPLPERFFAGGGSSLRGFALNQAGPRDPNTGFPIGGLTELVFNQELRFPMRLPFVASRLGGAVFYDAGNVFDRLGHINLRTSPSAVSTSTGDLNYFSHTVGFGFRYATPIGPVRLDLGYQLNPPQFFEPNGAGGRQLTTLPHFQFFFNIGSIF